MKKQPIEDFEVVYIEEGAAGIQTLMCSGSLLAHTCSELLLARCKVVGVCRLGEGPSES